MTTARRVLAGIILLGLAACRTGPRTSSEPEVRAPQAHFLEQSYVFVPKSPQGLLYEAQAAANIVVLQTLERAGSEVRHDATNANGDSRWRIARLGVITPLFGIRQLKDSSAAVRTPTFNPKLTYQVFAMRKHADAAGVSTNVTNWRYVDSWLGDLVFAHYSNGQAGCFYEAQEFVRVGNEFQCNWINSDSTNRAINFADGSFSTWYVRAGLGYERMWGFGADDAMVDSQLGGLLSVQYHLPFLTEDPQRPLYGDWRLRGTVEYENWFAAARGLQLALTGFGERAFGTGPGVPQYGWFGGASLTSDWLHGFGLFVRRHEGQDYYNISFVNRLDVWQYGVIFKIDRRDTFRR